ncbi:MAG: DUF3303 family protein [Chloroflexota bacterium]|jgi:hypothetical protein
MVFHIKQWHAPADCPYGKGGPQSLFDASAAGVTVRGTWFVFSQHTSYLIVEADDIMSVHAFLKPGMPVSNVEITPVTDQPMP